MKRGESSLDVNRPACTSIALLSLKSQLLQPRSLQPSEKGIAKGVRGDKKGPFKKKVGKTGKMQRLSRSI